MGFTTKHTILGRIGEGSEAGWDEFFQAYRPLIRLRGRDHGLHGAEVDDLVQDVMTEMFCGDVVLRYDRTRGKFRNYLKTVIDRMAWGIIRKREKHVVELPEGVDAEEMAPAITNVMEKHWDSAWRRHVVSEAMTIVKEQVKPSTWSAFDLIANQRKTPDEAADQLGVTIESVYVAKHRVLERIRDAVKNLGEDEQ